MATTVCIPQLADVEIPTDMPTALAANLHLATYEDGRFISDAYFAMSKTERDGIDNWLVKIEHPLAYVPGTQEGRISALIKQYG